MALSSPGVLVRNVRSPVSSSRSIALPHRSGAPPHYAHSSAQPKPQMKPRAPRSASPASATGARASAETGKATPAGKPRTPPEAAMSPPAPTHANVQVASQDGGSGGSLDARPSDVFEAKDSLDQETMASALRRVDDLLFTALVGKGQQPGGQSVRELAHGLIKGDAETVHGCVTAIYGELDKNTKKLNAIQEKLVSMESRMQKSEESIVLETEVRQLEMSSSIQRNIGLTNDVMELRRRLDQDFVDEVNAIFVDHLDSKLMEMAPLVQKLQAQAVEKSKSDEAQPPAVSARPASPVPTVVRSYSHQNLLPTSPVVRQRSCDADRRIAPASTYARTLSPPLRPASPSVTHPAVLVSPQVRPRQLVADGAVVRTASPFAMPHAHDAARTSPPGSFHVPVQVLTAAGATSSGSFHAPPGMATAANAAPLLGSYEVPVAAAADAMQSVQRQSSATLPAGATQEALRQTFGGPPGTPILGQGRETLGGVAPPFSSRDCAAPPFSGRDGVFSGRESGAAPPFSGRERIPRADGADGARRLSGRQNTRPLVGAVGLTASALTARGVLSGRQSSSRSRLLPVMASTEAAADSTMKRPFRLD